MTKKSNIQASSTAEYFSKNLQQVGFSSLTKSVLTTLKEAVDNSLDACEDAGILPEIMVKLKKIGPGTLKGSDRVYIMVEDNGPGIALEDVPKVFGEYLASSKFGKGRCSRGQQGIGISAATTWAQMTTGSGVKVTTKSSELKKAFSCKVEVDIKNNKGLVREKESVAWNKKHGTLVEFEIDGRMQLNGEAGLLNYLTATALVNPHLTLHYECADLGLQTLERKVNIVPVIPEATEPHPHTMKLGEFIAYSHLFRGSKLKVFLKKHFSRVHDAVLEACLAHGVQKSWYEKTLLQLSDGDLKIVYSALMEVPLMVPSTKSLLSIGEEGFEKSIGRLGAVDFFSVVSRKPAICDHKPILVEVAIARLESKLTEDQDSGSVSVLRFANRVPLQFDRSSCAIVKAIETVNWKAYGLAQQRNSVPQGPYIIAVSVVSPFIKFKNASKETIDASEELVQEIRKGLIQAGQKLSRYIRKEVKAYELEKKIRHIEQFCPILVDGICRITQASDAKKIKAEQGLIKILGREARQTEKELLVADELLSVQQAKGQRQSQASNLKTTAPKSNLKRRKA